LDEKKLLIDIWKVTVESFKARNRRPDVLTTYTSGPEYQLLEKSHPDYPDSSKRSGCLYGFGPQKNPVEATGFGKWYHSRIKQVGGKTEFYLNGVLTAQQDFISQDWFDKVEQSGFKNYPEFGKYIKGHIALQEWAKGISFKNIKIKELWKSGPSSKNYKTSQAQSFPFYG